MKFLEDSLGFSVVCLNDENDRARGDRCCCLATTAWPVLCKERSLPQSVNRAMV